MQRILVFDVNETLLDLSALEPVFEQSFGSPGVRTEWFQEALKLAFVTTITGTYSDFSAIGGAALEIVETRHRRPLSQEPRQQILQTMRRLPAHADVNDALGRLRQAGLRLVALTNSTLQTAETQLTNAGVRHFFERVFSADSVRRLKPAQESYLMVGRELAVEPDSLLMVAAHSWDVAGAMSVGWTAAFIARPGQVLDALTPKPDFVASDLRVLVHQILGSGGRAG